MAVIIPSAAVKSMQQVLITYAQGTGFSPANPGSADGIVGQQTVSAVIAVVPLLPGLPSEVKTIAALGPIVFTNASALASAKAFITKNAAVIRDGVIGLAAYQTITGKTPKVPINPVLVTAIPPGGYLSPVAKPWYKTWWGVGGLVFGGVVAVGTTVALVRR